MGSIHCKHYRGREMFWGKPCAAGVDPILSFCDGERFGWVKRAPCFKTNTDAPHCPACVYPTQAEVDAQYAALEARMDDFVKHMPKAREAILEIARETNASTGMIDCPKCGGNRLHWSRARSNGHVHAQCETADCLGWIE